MFINLTAQANIDLAKKKKSKLLELVTLESITPADFKAMTTQCNQEIKSGEQTLLELKDQQESSEEFRANMEHLRKVLRDAEKQCQTEAITKDFIDTFIDRIYVTPEDDNTLRLDITAGKSRRFYGSHVQEHFDAIDQGERYKWEAIAWYKKHWKIDSPNFAQMLEEAFGKAKNLLASAMYYPYRMIVASSVWVLPSRIFACWGIPQIPDLLLRAGNAFCKR